MELLERFHAAAVARVSGDPLAALHRAECLAWDPGPDRFDGAMLRKMVDLARRGVVVYLNDRRRKWEGPGVVLCGEVG